MSRDAFFPTSGSAEAHFQVVLFTALGYCTETGRTHILGEEIPQLEKLGFVFKNPPVNAFGQVTAELLAAVLRPRTGLVSLPWANELTGVLNPLYDLAPLCRERGVLLHVDASAVNGKLYFQFDDLGVDFLTFQGGIFAAREMNFKPFYKHLGPHAHFQEESIDHYCLEIARLRDLLEAELVRLIPGCQILFKGADRLSDTTVFAFPGIHGEVLCKKISATTGDGRLSALLLACGFDPHIAHAAVSLKLPLTATEDAIHHLLRRIADAAFRPRSPTKEEAAQKGMRLASGKAGEASCSLTCHLIVDEEDGIIADCKFEAFGPPALGDAAEAATRLILRKSYVYAKRVSAELIEKMLRTSNAYVNLVIDAIDEAANLCMDIPIDEQLIAPQAMAAEVAAESDYPEWEHFSNEKQKSIVEEVIARDIRPYVELDAGGVEIVKIEHPDIHIAYQGACTTCHSATGATLDAIQNILRNKIHSAIRVIPVLG